MAPTPSPASDDATRISFWRQLGLFDFTFALCGLLMVGFILWVVLTPGDGSWGFVGQHVPWLWLLGSTIILSEIGVLIPNFYDQKDPQHRRSHNHVKVLNESLAIHQVGYVSFYAAIITARFQGYGEGRMSGMLLAIICSLFFYVIAAKFVSDQEHNMEAKSLTSNKSDNELLVHHCAGADCTDQLSWKLRKRILGVNAILSLIAFIGVLVVAASPIVVSSPQQPPDSVHNQITPKPEGGHH